MIRQSMSISIYMKIDVFIAINFTGRTFYIDSTSARICAEIDVTIAGQYQSHKGNRQSVILIHLGPVQNACVQSIRDTHKKKTHTL